MDDLTFIKDYLNRYKSSLFETDISQELVEMKKMLLELKKTGKKVIIAGNGGSAAMASHVAVDFTKQGGIRTVNFNEADLITCFANDYGYEHWVAKAVEFFGDEGDAFIAISSSGSSVNILKGCEAARTKNFSSVITFSGFDSENPLRQLGDINLWVNSRAYNFVENIHQVWLLAIVDLIIGTPEYSA